MEGRKTKKSDKNNIVHKHCRARPRSDAKSENFLNGYAYDDRGINFLNYTAFLMNWSQYLKYISIILAKYQFEMPSYVMQDCYSLTIIMCHLKDT